MIPTALNEKIRRSFGPYRQPLQQLFAGMDRAYAAVAERSGFVCRGCEDNCCGSRFHHHTYLEYAYLLEGVEHFSPVRRAALREVAENSQKAIGSRSRSMCPLNLAGRCDLYRYRPMICRLHGIPHILNRPGQGPIRGPGCEAFARAGGTGNGVHLDRTPFYRQMADLELEFKEAAGLHQKLKLTIAEMILAFDAL